MSWLADDPGAASPFEAAIGLRPELLEGYRAFYGGLWDEDVLPARLLELCRLRIAGIHECAAEAAIVHETAELGSGERKALAERRMPDGLSDVERLALEIAAKLPFDVHGVGDPEVARLSDAIGEPALVAFMLAVSLFDANCRMRTVLDLEAVPRGVRQPASRTGVLY